ncbi:peptidoglycan editing factor PgeF [Shewanella sp. 202IG2-18]|uniref:peptidoglycan editing factor PgeF n=1 Tax=Parashewanella hymeniacidonis TaxID=2807618 RepID=UPI001960F1EE|nr:peptidoglycan editing factor PgeF [Parashewanella hymeniacidonis]MBM7071811.1 peptidoglycan editing factor PgeF [Parashewanella hymeniacidonis]
MFKHDWPVPKNVNIAFTDRHDGISKPPYDSLNLGLHVGDVDTDVLANRASLKRQLNLSAEPFWLEQVHGIHVADLSNSQNNQADGSYSNQTGNVCVVMTADCLPVLLCNQAGTEVAAIHAGWRGLCNGVLEAGVAKFKSASNELTAYLGPAIGPKAFEVGVEVREAFINESVQAEQYFQISGKKYLADIYGLAIQRLNHLGVTQVYSANECTVSNSNYFSYRRNNRTGRQASLIWLDE